MLTKRRGQSTIIEDYRRQRVNLKPHHFAMVRFSILINQLLYKKYGVRFFNLKEGCFHSLKKHHYQLN